MYSDKFQNGKKCPKTKKKTFRKKTFLKLKITQGTSVSQHFSFSSSIKHCCRCACVNL